MISIKNIFCLLFSLCTLFTTFFASLPITKVLFVINKNFGRTYHINQPIQIRNFGWQQWRKKIFGPVELPLLKAKGIEGFTEEQEELVKYFLEPDKNIHKLLLEQQTPLTKLAIEAISESNKKATQRMVGSSDSTKKSE